MVLARSQASNAASLLKDLIFFGFGTTGPIRYARSARDRRLCSTKDRAV